MFGIGSTELIVILLVALIVLGPKSLAGAARSIGKVMGEFRRVSTDFQRTLNMEAAQEEMREAEKIKRNNDVSSTNKKADEATVQPTQKADETLYGVPTDSPVAQAMTKAREQAKEPAENKDAS